MHCMNYAKREQEKPLFFKPTLRSRFTPSRAQSLCLTCQHFGLTTNCAKKTSQSKPPIDICPCHSRFEPILCTNAPFANALYKRFRASATQAIAQKIHEF